MEEGLPQGKDKYLAGMEQDIVEMDELTRELLTYAQLEREAPNVQLQPVPALPWVDTLISQARQAAESAGITVNIVTHVEAQDLRCEPRYMARAAANLLRNAVSYARTTVSFTVEKSGEKTYIHVDDDGPGIPVQEREHLFEPFTRLDQSRTRTTGGFGLGPSIVKQIARWHRGDAAIGDSPLGGARVTISW
jgi:signal transduction histidine kinase